MEYNNTIEQKKYSFNELHFFIPNPKPERINNYIVLGLDDTLYLAKNNVYSNINTEVLKRILVTSTNDMVTHPAFQGSYFEVLFDFTEKRTDDDGRKIYGSAFPKKYFKEIDQKVGSNIWVYLELLDEFFKCSDKIVESAPKIVIDNKSVKEAQQLLNYLGYKAGSEDGVFGLTTAEALVEFGQANKFEHASLGFITDNVLIELRHCKELNKCFVEK